MRKKYIKDKDTNDYTANGDGLADVLYKISNGNVSYHYERVIGSEDVADATPFHKVVALKDLVKEFYGNAQQKSQIDALVAKVKIQSALQ
ncbi:Lreu_0056 family protein [Apilactobacillus kunkeei]|uniref:Lreu_0056 family protein n=1 Tax=Apilactobacillus kunkeei TaxID=148814 RepID=UPI0040348DD4